MRNHIRVRNKGFAVVMLTGVGCGSLTPNYEHTRPDVAPHSRCATDPSRVAVWSDGSSLSRFEVDLTSVKLDPPVTTQTRGVAYSTRAGWSYTETKSIEWNGRFTRGDAAYNASQLAPAAGAAAPGSTFLGDVRTPNVVVQGLDYDLLACGWANRTEDFAQSHPRIAPLDVDSEWCRAVGQPLIAELHQKIATEASARGANAVHQLRCFGRSTSTVSHVWCEGRAYGSSTPPSGASCAPRPQGVLSRTNDVSSTSS
jgi:hypothetical protein